MDTAFKATTDIDPDGTIWVTVQQDGLRLKAFCPSQHLVDDKIAQLAKEVRKRLHEAYGL